MWSLCSSQPGSESRPQDGSHNCLHLWFIVFLLIPPVWDRENQTQGIRHRGVLQAVDSLLGETDTLKKLSSIEVIILSWTKTSTIYHLYVESKKNEIIPSIFSDHNAVRLDVNYRRKTIKNSNIWRLNYTRLNNQQITEEIKKEIKICIKTNENENTTTQNLWDT